MTRCRLIILTVVLLSMICSVCMASIPRSELALGGVTLFTRFANVQHIYGQPTSTSYKDYNIWGGTSRFYTQRYGNGSFIVTATNRDGVVSVTTTADNGIGTPAGIKVGMNQGRLAMVYGEVDSIWDDNNGDKIFVYNVKYEKMAAEPDSLQFTVRNGRIIKISLVAGILSI